jgi:arabinan endo-1,5-alpha-L-arabinosidase
VSAAATLRSAVAAASLFVGSCALVPPAGPTYVNPVLDGDFPDPAVLHAPDGWFYAYATQGAASGRMLNIQVARSRDLVEWQHQGDALPVKPGWGKTKQNFWAPHVLYDSRNKLYFMYYSAEPDDARGKCLAVATATRPLGPFVDSGKPMLCGQGIEHIDPMAFDDPKSGKLLLYWGSGQLPLKARELAPDRLAFLAGSAPKDLLFPDDKKYRTLIEAPWVVFRNGYYYLFYSGDRCCARNPRYAVMVARATHPLGPFENFSSSSQRTGSAIVERDGFWLAPGHNSIATDSKGTDWILYHAMDAARAYYEDRPRGAMSARRMMLDRIEYREGWPRVQGHRPSSSAQVAPTIGPIEPPLSSGTRENARP